jgi:uncharacterized protein (DUF433 family)
MTESNIIQAFSEDQVARLTGLSKGQLRSWDKGSFFAPRYAYEDRRSAYSRVYSFRDVVGLRTIAVLMQQYRVSLQELRKVAAELVRRGYQDWAGINLYVVKKKVHFQRPESGDVEGVWDGQYAMLPVIDVISDIQYRVQQLRRRSTGQYGKVEKHKYVVRNSPVIAGTRIPTAAIRRFHEAGYSTDQILKEYPSLTAEDVEAALSYEQRLARSA